MSSTNESATSAITAPLRSRLPPPNAAARLLPRSTPITSGREACHAGANPKIAAAAIPAIAVNASTAGSMRMESRRGRFAGAMARAGRAPPSQAEERADAGEQERLREQLARQLPPVRAQSRSDRELAFPQ
jgi:hypothetical protein